MKQYFIVFMDRDIIGTCIKTGQVHIITRVTSGEGGREGGRGIEWGEKYKRHFSCSCHILFPKKILKQIKQKC